MFNCYAPVGEERNGRNILWIPLDNSVTVSRISATRYYHFEISSLWFVCDKHIFSRGDQNMGLPVRRREKILFPSLFLCSHDDVSLNIQLHGTLCGVQHSCIREQLLEADFSGCMKLLQVRDHYLMVASNYVAIVSIL